MAIRRAIVDEAIEEYTGKLAARVRTEDTLWRIIGGTVFLLSGILGVILLVALPDRIVVSAPLLFAALWGFGLMCDPRWARFSPFGRPQ